MTIVTGLRGDRVVLVNRAHHAMVDGVSSVDILTLLVDTDPEGYTPVPPEHGWQPRPEPSGWQLIRPVLWNFSSQVKSERTRLPTLWHARRLPWTGMLKMGGMMVKPRTDLFFNRAIGPQRTGRGLKVPLAAFKALKDRFGCTVNDAVLAVVSEGLHRWFKARGEVVPAKVRVFCPVSVRGDDSRGRLGNQISGMVLELPTGDLRIEEIGLHQCAVSCTELHKRPFSDPGIIEFKSATEDELLDRAGVHVELFRQIPPNSLGSTGPRRL